MSKKTQFVYTTFSELAIYMYWTRNSVVILWVSWCKSRSFWQRFTCTDAYADANSDKSANRGKILVWLDLYVVWYDVEMSLVAIFSQFCVGRHWKRPILSLRHKKNWIFDIFRIPKKNFQPWVMILYLNQ